MINNRSTAKLAQIYGKHSTLKNINEDEEREKYPLDSKINKFNYYVLRWELLLYLFQRKMPAPPPPNVLIDSVYFVRRLV